MSWKKKYFTFRRYQNRKQSVCARQVQEHLQRDQQQQWIGIESYPEKTKWINSDPEKPIWVESDPEETIAEPESTETNGAKEKVKPTFNVKL